MRGKQVVVELAGGRIDVVLYSGTKRSAAKRIPITLPGDPGEWSTAVRHAGVQLREAVEELGATGATAAVLYRSPTHSVDLSSFPVNAAEALEAAKLECLDALPYSDKEAVCESALAGRDADGGQRHVLAAAERDDVARAIVDLVESAGLIFSSATPLDAAIMANLVVSVLQQADPQTAWLSVGEHSSFFVVAEQGNLVFTRQIGIGLDALTTSLTRPIQLGGGAVPISLDASKARRVLHEFGVPARDAVVDESLGLKGGQLIPLMQPVLQRFIVELRQSLRFGLTEEQRQQASILLRGAGSTLPGLAELISTELSVRVTTDESCQKYSWVDPGSPGSELAEVVRDRKRLEELNLQPRALRRERRSRRLQHWLWTGAAAALLVIGVDAVRYRHALGEIRKEAEAIQAEASGQEALRETNERLGAVVSAMSELEGKIQDELGLRPSYRAIMHELTRLTPESIRLNLIRISKSDGRTLGMLSGFAFDLEGELGRTELEPFIERFRASPLFSNVGLENVQLGEAAARPGERFQVVFSSVIAPSEVTTDLAAAEPEQQR